MIDAFITDLWTFAYFFGGRSFFHGLRTVTT